MSTTVTRLHPLRRLWARLPDRPLSERELEEAILETSGHRPGDYAWAGAMRSALVAAHAVTVTRRDDGQLEYARGRWTDWPDASPGTPAYNAELARRQAVNEAELKLADQARAREFAASPAGRQRQQILELIDSRIDERVKALVDARIAELSQHDRAALAAQHTDLAGAGQREGD